MSNKRHAQSGAAVRCSALVRPTHEINQRLNLSGYSLTAVCILLNVLCLQRSEVNAQVSGSVFLDKISPRLAVIRPQVLKPLSMSLGYIRLSENASKPPTEKSSQIVASLNAISGKSEPMRSDYGNDAAKPTDGHRKKINLHGFVIGWILAMATYIAWEWLRYYSWRDVWPNDPSSPTPSQARPNETAAQSRRSVQRMVRRLLRVFVHVFWIINGVGTSGRIVPRSRLSLLREMLTLELRQLRLSFLLCFHRGLYRFYLCRKSLVLLSDDA